MSLTLHFTEWECGHHQQRPANIQVSSLEQAAQILTAISCSISQPGHAHAVLMDETHATPIYLTDDYFSVGHAADGVMPENLLSCSSERPIIFYGTEAEIAQLESETYARAADYVYGAALARWIGKCFFDDSVGMTTLSLAELEALTDPDRLPKTGELFDLPPIFRPASAALQELQAEIDETNGVVTPYELPDILIDKTLLPANGAHPLSLSYNGKGYMATNHTPRSSLHAREYFHSVLCHGLPRPGLYLGVSQTQLHGRMYASESIYMVPDCYGNLTEVLPW